MAPSPGSSRPHAVLRLRHVTGGVRPEPPEKAQEGIGRTCRAGRSQSRGRTFLTRVLVAEGINSASPSSTVLPPNLYTVFKVTGPFPDISSSTVTVA